VIGPVPKAKDSLKLLEQSSTIIQLEDEDSDAELAVRQNLRLGGRS